MAFNIRGVIALDGEKEFKAAVADANTALNTMKSALSLVEEQCKSQSDSLESLEKKHDALADAIEASKAKEEALRSALSNAVSSYEKVGKGLQELNEEYEEQKKKLDEMKASGSASNQELEEQEQKVNDLASAIEKGNKNYQTAENRVNKWQTQLNKAETETAKMTNELNETDQQLEEVSASANSAASSVDEFKGEAKEAATATTSLGEKLKTAFVNKAVSSGIDLVKDGLQELVEVAKEVVEVGSEFEASMSEVAAISGATGDDLEALTEKAKEMGETTKYTASEAAEAFSYMALAGWDTEEMLSGIDGVLNLAAAADMDLAEASDIVTDYLTAFGLAAEDSAEFVDMMAYAMANSNTTVEDLGEAYKNCAATASSLGYSAEEVTAVLATMANAGIKGGEAGTALNTIMTRLATDTKDCATALSAYGVEVYDSEGNMNSLSSILEGMSGIWETLSDEQQANLAKTIAGTNQYSALQTVMSGLSEEAEASGKSFSDYAEALEDCTGTAEEMAETMQDNLQGDLTKLNSALQGLGIEAYEYVEGPLRSVVQGVTNIIGGITDAISPQEDALESMVSSAKEATQNVKTAVSSAESTVTDAVGSAAEIEALGTALINLNSIEDKSALQQQRMTEIVDTLSGQIPELAEAYNEETGEINLSNEAIEALIESTKQLTIVQAMQEAIEDETAALAESTVALERAKIAQESYLEEKEFWEELSGSMMDLYDQYGDLSGAQELVTEAFNNGKISAEEYQEAIDALSTNNLASAQYYAQSKITDYDQALNDAEQTVKACETANEEAQESYDTLCVAVEKAAESYTEAATAADVIIDKDNELIPTVEDVADAVTGNFEANEKLRKETDELSDAIKNGTNASVEAADEEKNYAFATEEAYEAAKETTKAEEDLSEANEEVSSTAEDAAESTEELESTLDDAAAAAEKSAEAQKTAFNNIYDAYTSTFESIAEDLKNKIDLTSKFDGGDDITTETMNANLESYIEGLQTYQENLEKVRSMVDESGNKIFSDDVLAEIEANGTDMANMLEHIVWTYENQGEYGIEQIEGINDQWQEALDMSEEIARVGAANQTAYELATGELGSTDVDFSNLREAIDEAVESAGEGWSGLTDETQAALQEAIDLALSMGAQIPDGLADSIANGETSAEQAIEQLNASIQGTLEGLLLVAQNSGADVSEELASSISAGTADAETAMTELMTAISNSAEGDGSVASAVESEVDDAVETISEKSEELEESGGEITDSIATGITDNEEALTGAVDEVVTAGAEAAKSGDHQAEYEEAGKALVDSMATGVTGSSTTGEEAASELSKAIAEAATEILLGNDILADFQSAGLEGAKAYGEGIQQGTDTAGTYAEDLATVISDALAEDISGFQDAAFKAVFAYNSEFSAADALSDAAGQAQILAQAASDALNDADKSGIEGAGADVEDAYATAMASSSMLSDTRAQAQKLAAAALEGVKYNQGDFRTAGYNMASGLASGITSGQSTVITAAKNTAAAALSAAKSELGIHSPSAVFREEVGQQIGKGMAFGIDDSASLAGESAEKMSEKVYAKASAWLTEYKKTRETTLDDEQYFWTEITKHCEEGSSAYEKALSNYNTALAKSIKSSVSTTTTSGSGKNATTVAKDTEEYYSDVFDAAQDYMDKLETISDVSLEEQLSYWKAVQAQLQEGTDAWYDAQKEINSINDSLYSTIVSEAKQALSNMKVLNDVSLKDEIKYWKQVRKQIVAEGGKYTDDWYEVTETIKDLREDYYDSLIEETEDTIEKEKILNDLSVEDELAYWEKLLKKLEKKGLEYSDQWYEVYENVKDLQEEYYDDLLDTAEDELDKLETTTGMSLSQQLSYWQSYLGQFEEESDQWYSVLKKINDIQDQIGTTSAASDLLSAYETYFDLSELAEMQYWDTVRQAYEEGTDERLKADQEYLEAKEAYYDKLEELETDYADSVKEIEENLAEQVEDLWNEYYSAVESRTEEIANAFGLFDEFYSESDDGQTLLYNLQTQVAGYQDWADTLKALEQRGILSEELLSELTAMGPEQSAALHALYDLTDEELTAYNEAYTQKMEIAAQQAADENEELKATIEAQVEELQTQTSEELEELKKTYEENVSAVNTTISDELYSLAKNIQTIAEDQTTALVYAILQNGSASSSSDASSLTSSSGFASGGRNIKDELVWMDEELSSKGAELVVNRSDNALLTRLPSGGNDIIDADTTSNLFNWGSIDPDELLSVVAKQQDAAVSYLNEMGAVGSVSQLNDLMEVGAGSSVYTTDTSTMEGLLANMAGVMEQFLPYLAEKTTVSIDKSSLAKSIASDVGSELTKISRRTL